MGTSRSLAALGASALAVACGLATTVPASAAPAVPTLTYVGGLGVGDGGPATQALVAPTAITTVGTGSLLYDSGANELRAVSATGTITALAGNGQRATGDLDTSSAATQTALPLLRSVVTDAAGDLFVQENQGFLFRYELTAGDTAFHQIGSKIPSAAAWTVLPNGAVIYTAKDQLFEIAPGAALSATGTAIAGIAGQVGDTGDGGSALAAKIGTVTFLAAGPDGTIYFSEGAGLVIRAISPGGIVTTVAGTGAQNPTLQPGADDGLPATSARVDVESLAVASDGTVVFGDSRGSAAEIRAFQPGGDVVNVMSPSAFAHRGNTCVDTRLATAGTNLVTLCGTYLGSYPLNGSASATQGSPYAGQPGLQEPANGAALANTWLYADSVAVDPTGGFAYSDGPYVRHASAATGAAPTSALATLPSDPPGLHGPASGRNADQLAYGADGTLYAASSINNVVKVYKIGPGSSVTPILGGGTATGAARYGKPGTSDALPGGVSLAVGGNVLYVAESTANDVLALNLTTNVVSLAAGTGTQATSPAGTAAAATYLPDPYSMAYNPVSQALWITTQQEVVELAAGTVTQITSSPTPQLAALNDGSMLDGEHLIRADGSESGIDATEAASNPPKLSNDFAPDGQLPDGDVLVTTTAPNGRTVLQTLSGIPAASALPTAGLTVTPASDDAIAVSVTPPGVAGDHVQIVVAAGGPPLSNTDGVLLEDLTDDGSGTPVTSVFTRDSTTQTSGPAFAPGVTYYVAAFVTANNTFEVGPSVTKTVVTSADTTAPAGVASISATQGYGRVVTFTTSTESTLDHVLICWATGDTAPTSPSCATSSGALGLSMTVRPNMTYRTQVSTLGDDDPYSDYSISIFEVDVSGNTSTASTVVSPAAAQSDVDPGPATWLYAQEDNGTELVHFTAPPVFTTLSGPTHPVLRYAAGAVAPATPTDGIAANTCSPPAACIAGLTSGQVYSFALFQADGAHFTRTAVTLTAGIDQTFIPPATSFSGGVTGDSVALSWTRPASLPTDVQDKLTQSPGPAGAATHTVYKGIKQTAAATVKPGADTTFSLSALFDDITSPAETLVVRGVKLTTSAPTQLHSNKAGTVTGHAVVDSQAVAGMALQLWQQSGGDWTSTQTATTASNGSATFTVKETTATAYEVRYAGGSLAGQLISGSTSNVVQPTLVTP